MKRDCTKAAMTLQGGSKKAAWSPQGGGKEVETRLQESCNAATRRLHGAGKKATMMLLRDCTHGVWGLQGGCKEGKGIRHITI